MYSLTIKDVDKIKTLEEGNTIKVNLGVVELEIMKVHRNEKGELVKIDFVIPDDIITLSADKPVLNRISKKDKARSKK